MKKQVKKIPRRRILNLIGLQVEIKEDGYSGQTNDK